METYSVILQNKNQRDSSVNDYFKYSTQPFIKPLVQPKFSLNNPNDIYEQEADAMADKVMRMPLNKNEAPFFRPITISSVQRKCAACGEEEKELQRKEENDENVADSYVFQNYIGSLNSKGESLPAGTRSFFEPRFGHDFSNVKVHTDNLAAKSARSVNALAYTSGNNIVFNNGQYSPGTDSGKKLLGHELTHVIQQNNSMPLNIQRMTIGGGAPPARFVAESNARVVPPGDLEQVNNAISMVRNIANNPGDYADCLRVFTENCPGNSPTAFVDAFNNATIWKADDDTAYAFTLAHGTDIFYTQSGYDQGARGLAQTLVHEMGHNCGISGERDHYFAEVSANYCVGPANILGFRFGLGLNTNYYSLALTYRRLFDLALGGQLQFTLGTDIDLWGIIGGSASELSGRYTEPFQEFEMGSAMAGFRGRSNLLWGGESFGGLTLGAEVGVDVGRFRVVRETTPDEFEYGPGVVLQSTLGAEFYVPTNPQIINFSVDVGYRYIRPANPQAREIHSIIFGVSGMF